MLVPRRRAANFVFCGMTVFIGLSLIGLLIIPLFGWGWHLLHADFIFLDGWKVPVPKGFYVRLLAGGPEGFGCPTFGF